MLWLLALVTGDIVNIQPTAPKSKMRLDNNNNGKVEMTQNHLIICPVREKFREGLGISKLDDIVL